MSRAWAVPTFVALMLLLPALAVLTAPAGGQITPELRFGFSRDFPLDTNNNTLYDQLVIELVVDITQEGTYTVVCDLYVMASGNQLLIDSLFQDEMLEEGNNTVTIVFDSEAIYEMDHSGTFSAKVQVHSTTSEHSWRFTHLTGFYDHRAFEAEENPPPAPADAPHVEYDEGYINVSTGTFQVYVNMSSPEFIYRYRQERPDLPFFVVTLTRLVFFADDGGGLFNDEAPASSVLLANYRWSVGNVEVLGPRVSFDLGARVPIPIPGGYVSADVTVKCIVTNGTSPYPGTSQFLQGGASELKLDLTIDLAEGVPGADHVALETTVGDTLGNHDFLLEEPSGFRLLPRTVDTAFEPVPRMPGTQHTRVGLVDGNRVEHAFLGWIDEATESRGQEPVTVDVGASFRVRGGLLELVWSYPYSHDLTSLTHDPSVGIVEDNLPPMPPGPLPPGEPVPNVYVFLFALVVGAVILILSVYARAQGY